MALRSVELHAAGETERWLSSKPSGGREYDSHNSMPLEWVDKEAVCWQSEYLPAPWTANALYLNSICAGHPW
jgi:hypothetical protein